MMRQIHNYHALYQHIDKKFISNVVNCSNYI